MENLSNNISDHQLPEIEDLFKKGDDEAFKHNKLLTTLNHPCHSDWLKAHPTLKVKGQTYFYLPIDKVRWLLNRVFGLFVNEEIVSFGTYMNAYVVHVRLRYCVPGTNIWLFKDGIGAVAVQLDKGQQASNLSAVKSDSAQKGMPAAASYAVSNAAEKLGALFGSLLNKPDAIPFMGLDEDLHGKIVQIDPASIPKEQIQWQQPQQQLAEHPTVWQQPQQQPFQNQAQPLYPQNTWDHPATQQQMQFQQPMPPQQQMPQAPYGVQQPQFNQFNPSDL